MSSHCIICGSLVIHARKHMCDTCYARQWRKDNPEKYKLQRLKTLQFRKDHPEIVKQWIKNEYDRDPERMKQKYKEYQRRYFEKYPEKKKEHLEKLQKAIVCNILKRHAIEMKDDPEHLTTEFIQNIIGIECKKKAKQ